ncbi:ATP-binding protein [Streptomyces sp. NPDC088725]|uniref:ATP-binding protein n=1 Tax=Streptomyces sp. NPDC088725 TaxID=3365873 RepID=UPI0037FE3D14
MNSRPAACAVVIPAHNEAAVLPDALRAVRAAMGHPALAGVRLLTVVAADDCADETAEAGRRAGARVVEVARHNVGAARAAAADLALGLLGTYGDGLWIATTDADTLVPRDWLAHQLHQAGRGWECVVGTVRIAPHPLLGPATAAGHDARYFADRPAGAAGWSHSHVHGANLGVAAAPYREAGGFPALVHSEDRALVAALERRGRRILRTDRCPVLTSGRPDFRAPHGLGALLDALARDADQPDSDRVCVRKPGAGAPCKSSDADVRGETSVTNVEQSDSDHADNFPAPVPVPDSAAAARDLVEALLRARVGRLDETVLGDILLVTSELATNAIRHGGGITRFEAELTGDCLVLLVADRSSAVPSTVAHHVNGVSIGGYGWPLVRRLARDVTVTPYPGGGKRIKALVSLAR